MFRDINHNNPTDCQLFLAITGSKQAVVETLKKLVAECENSYGKPVQGVSINWHSTTEVITPIWEGKKY